MWLMQEIRKCWEKKGLPVNYDFLMEAAGQAEAFADYMDVDDESFIVPADMEETIVKYMARTGQPEIQGQGCYYHVIMKSLAFKCRQAITELENICQKKFEKIYLARGFSLLSGVLFHSRWKKTRLQSRRRVRTDCIWSRKTGLPWTPDEKRPEKNRMLWQDYTRRFIGRTLRSAALSYARPQHAMAFAVTDEPLDSKTIPESYIYDAGHSQIFRAYIACAAGGNRGHVQREHTDCSSGKRLPDRDRPHHAQCV